jgi:hypothetical protein
MQAVFRMVFSYEVEINAANGREQRRRISDKEERLRFGRKLNPSKQKGPVSRHFLKKLKGSVHGGKTTHLFVHPELLVWKHGLVISVSCSM